MNLRDPIYNKKLLKEWYLETELDETGNWTEPFPGKRNAPAISASWVIYMSVAG